jgi:hypothetical protein
MFRGDSRGRWPIIIVALVAFVLASLTRDIAANRRGEKNLANATPLSRMNSYALALLLGGLRGPLVMFLWPSSEGQKTEKNLEDFDTKVEWIRLLQAEFDTVHIFQIWNKAYNISVLMANLPNKYATILDALQYGSKVDAERPANLTIIFEIARIFGDKLGNSAEKQYYMQRVRDESMARQPMMRVTFPIERRQQFLDAAAAAGIPAQRVELVSDPEKKMLSATIRQSQADVIKSKFDGEQITWAPRQRAKLNPNAPGFRRTELDPMLDREGNILPELLEPRGARAAGALADGSELQFLKQFQPYPYGISAHGLAYNYYKRSQALLRHANQHHAQLADLVVDSRPALALRNWADDEWERGRYSELAAFGIVPPPEARDQRFTLEAPARELPLSATPVNTDALTEAIYAYDLAYRVTEESLREYEGHLEKFRTNFSQYRQHMADMAARARLLAADRDFLKLMSAPPAERAALAKSAIDNYRQAEQEYQLVLLTYYVEEGQMRMFPEGVTRENVAHKLTPQQFGALVEAIRNDVIRLGSQGAAHFDDWNEYLGYIRRAQARLKTLGDAPAVAQVP